jgi:hypothetical protein
MYLAIPFSKNQNFDATDPSFWRRKFFGVFYSWNSKIYKLKMKVATIPEGLKSIGLPELCNILKM